MKKLYPDLWQTALYDGGMVNSYAYLLTRPNGNILFYNTGDNDELQHIEELGGIRYQLLTHRDEAGPSLERIRKRFNSQLLYSEAESDAISQYAKADQLLELKDTRFEDIEVLFTPGHTDGSVCYIYHSPHGLTYLFTGDTFFQWDGRWTTFIIHSFGGSEDSTIQSLKKLRSVKPNVVMSSGFIGKIGLVEPTYVEWVSAIDGEINRLKLHIDSL
ncbi:MBL fold metallo-hydrolase [Vibrio nigripulchritudo]|uniref:MBL fold metallo-hydrolase n=1 Tax=Vibrio nigripulchritudo TaxID=28173 RepID=UPI00248FC05B|nr:MBL fold metallo-hydrolase [Vibrio nigripulchritudo]BDU39966.1 MBL fold metallo-hydrolase [Vibrio nigripulchritudo]BDU45690.1 MBL fold metallo-hydrolase [Vibrio nigripulchritudo]